MAYQSISTKYGSPDGRNAIYLDRVEFDYENQSVRFFGQIDANMSDGYEGTHDWPDYEISYQRVVHFVMTELDHFDLGKINQMESSIEVDLDSQLIETLKEYDHAYKIRPEHKHVLFLTYGDVFDVVATEIIINVYESKVDRLHTEN